MVDEEKGAPVAILLEPQATKNWNYSDGVSYDSDDVYDFAVSRVMAAVRGPVWDQRSHTVKRLKASAIITVKDNEVSPSTTLL